MFNKEYKTNTISTANMVKASGVVALIGVVSKLLGFIRETVIAAVFGATGVTDSYLVAYMLPSVLFASIGAAIVTVFIPVYTEVNNRQGNQAAFALINKFGTAALLLVGVLVLMGEIFAPAVVRVLAPGFSGSTFDLTVSLTRLLTPVMVLLTLSYLATASLNAQRKFTVPAAIGLPYNIIIIGATLLLGRTFGIFGLAIGTILAVASQFFIQLPSLYKSGYRMRLKLDFADPNLRKIGLLLG
ncbi:MAG: murein biosynthesis integral membrane protein MurJ, partial [Firmicutes bacterium]|nr:murein biosynthesis integral membrane protein MurJ [Bacillota bacterium]